MCCPGRLITLCMCMIAHHTGTSHKPLNKKSRPIFTFIEKDCNGCCGGGAFTKRNGLERTGTQRNGQEWTSITGMDFKIHPKIHVLSVLDKKFLKYFLSCPDILVPYYLRLTYTSHL